MPWYKIIKSPYSFGMGRTPTSIQEAMDLEISDYHNGALEDAQATARKCAEALADIFQYLADTAVTKEQQDELLPMLNRYARNAYVERAEPGEDLV